MGALGYDAATAGNHVLHQNLHFISVQFCLEALSFQTAISFLQPAQYQHPSNSPGLMESLLPKKSFAIYFSSESSVLLGYRVGPAPGFITASPVIISFPQIGQFIVHLHHRITSD
mgnify:CR=1 FL=1